MLTDKLKAETRGLHDEVESKMGSSRIMKEDYSLDEYRELLQKLWQAHSVLEPAILKYEEIAVHPKLEVEKRLHKRKLLGADLEELSAAPGRTLPDFDVQLPSPAHAWGALYVLEGSSLGGAMIYKQLKKRDWDVQAFRFYNCYGPETGKMWSRFKNILLAENQPEEEKLKDVIAGANMAYGTFIKTAG